MSLRATRTLPLSFPKGQLTICSAFYWCLNSELWHCLILLGVLEVFWFYATLIISLIIIIIIIIIIIKGGLKTQNGRFPSKIALRLKKVCYKVSLCENCQRQSCKAFIGLSRLVRDAPFCVIIWRIDPPLAKRRFSIYFRP